jgi:hypothetical protein
MIEQLLKSSPLSQVIFVHDYIQLIFESIGLSIFNKVELHSDGKVLQRKDLGFCDPLVSLIDQPVAKIEIEIDKDFSITFENLTTLVISLHPNDAIGPEAFQLVDGQGVIIVG